MAPNLLYYYHRLLLGVGRGQDVALVQPLGRRPVGERTAQPLARHERRELLVLRLVRVRVIGLGLGLGLGLG